MPKTLAEGKRVALVVGNAAYKHAGELRNPRNDARDVADSLEKLGFTVISGSPDGTHPMPTPS